MKNLFALIVLLLAVSTLGYKLAAEKDYTDFVVALSQKIKQAPWKYSAYERLGYITDTYGPRMWGSVSLEQVIYEIAGMASKVGFDNVRLEQVKNFTKWVRGTESLTLLSPRPTPSKLDVIGLGGSVSGDVEAEVIVVRNWDELEAAKDKVSGKIVCYNNEWVDYSNSVAYRVDGASRAAKYGARAILVRSVASESISSVHTGYMEYNPQYPKIPCAAITVEDAEMLQRMQKRGQTIKLRLVLQNEFVPNTYSNNVVFEILGATYPDQIVVAGGHIDTWDTGSQTGANDDGGGFITVFEAFRLLKENGFRPKRTLRFIAWSGEESGSERDGAAQYAEMHAKELDKHVAAFESDLGSTKLLGFGHSGSGADIVKDVLTRYLSILGAGYYSDDGYSADVEPLLEKGVPIFNNYIQDTPDHSFYFKYHHSAGDSMTMMDPEDMDSNVVGIAAFLYIIADLEKTVRDVPTF
jgi:carboxypeptidase Q